jgi:APA family basic amino acid/polyamine antiporter
VAIALAAALAIAFVMVQRFEQLADTFVLAIWPFYALGVAAIYPIRRKRLGSEYRTWGYPLTPALFVAAAMLVLGNALIEDAKNALRLLSGESAPSGTGGTLLVFAVIIIGIPIYRLWDRWPRR